MMSDILRLTVIKLIHTLIWLLFNIVLFYMAYEVIADRMDQFMWIGVAAVLFEGMVLVVFKMVCPLTILARAQSKATTDNFDIYLPNWLARYNKVIYTTLFVLILVGALFRVLKK